MSVAAVELIDDELLLRPYRPEDVPAVHQAARESHAELSTWMSWYHANYAIEDTRSFILSRPECWEADDHYSFGVFHKADGRFLGGVGINFMNRVHQMANLGYWIRSSETGRGIASRATRLVAGFGFTYLGLQRIEILAATTNIPSQRVAEKAGAVREAVLRKRLRLHDEPVDAVLYSLVAEDM